MSADLTAAEYLALGARKRSKYGNEPIVIDGERFDSTGEAGRWVDLSRLRDAGEIRNLRRQVRYPLVVNDEPVATFVADFVYDEGGATIVEDFKGHRTPMYRLKKRLMWAIHQIAIRETGR